MSHRDNLQLKLDGTKARDSARKAECLRIVDSLKTRIEQLEQHIEASTTRDAVIKSQCSAFDTQIKARIEELELWLAAINKRIDEFQFYE